MSGAERRQAKRCAKGRHDDGHDRIVGSMKTDYDWGGGKYGKITRTRTCRACGHVTVSTSTAVFL